MVTCVCPCVLGRAGFDVELGTSFHLRHPRRGELLLGGAEMGAPSPPKVMRSLSDGACVFPVRSRLFLPRGNGEQEAVVLLQFF